MGLHDILQHFLQNSPIQQCNSCSSQAVAAWHWEQKAVLTLCVVMCVAQQVLTICKAVYLKQHIVIVFAVADCAVLQPVGLCQMLPRLVKLPEVHHALLT